MTDLDQRPPAPSHAPGPPFGATGLLDLATAARLPAAEVLTALGSGPDGLDRDEAARRLVTFGRNALQSHRVRMAAVLLRQLRNPLLILLLAAAAVCGLTGDPTDALIIAVIVALSVGLGFLNEYRAEQAVAALHAGIRHEAVAFREGRAERVETTALVPGDVIVVRTGDLVPADARILEVEGLECDEAVLTGESVPVPKSADPVPASGAVAASVIWMGTVVHEGAGRAVVVATGSATAFGRIAVGLGERPGQTAFQSGLRQFSRLLVGVTAALTVSIFALNVSLSRPIVDALLFSLAIAVGMTPEMMPAVVTVSLSAGARALARRRVLVKRLVAIEDLGNIEILFTDKTGTLTGGTITFSGAFDAEGRADAGLLEWGLLCNEASSGPDGPVGGNTLDRALWTYATQARPRQVLDGVASWDRIGLLPFDHERRLASVLLSRPGDTPPLLVTKGAPEDVLARCPHRPAGAEVTLARLFAEGARVLAVGTRSLPRASGLRPGDEEGLDLAGFLVFEDRPKPDALESIAALGRLGVSVRIITGDNGVVAARVCEEIGLRVEGALDGAALEAMDDEELSRLIPVTTVFSRVTPDQKSRIIKLARRSGQDVAFLGDGVNDAVALHHADVGISVESATEVAKDAADVVLLDKDLRVLADGVMEGRRIFANTLKYVLMATSSNFGNMFSAAGASLFLPFLPMLPSQILLNNLLYDAGQLAIPSDRVDPEALARPAAWDIAFVRRFMAVFGPVSSVFDFATFGVMIWLLHAGHAEFRTGWFVESLATQTLVVYVIRTRRVPFLRSPPSRLMLVVPLGAAVVGVLLTFSPLRHVLGFAALPAVFFLTLLGMIVTYLLLAEVVKDAFFRRYRRPVKPPTTHVQRLERRIRRRAARFIHHRRGSPRRS